MRARDDTCKVKILTRTIRTARMAMENSRRAKVTKLQVWYTNEYEPKAESGILLHEYATCAVAKSVNAGSRNARDDFSYILGKNHHVRFKSLPAQI